MNHLDAMIFGCDPEPPPTLVRPDFVARMEAELQANQHKGDWRRWYPTALQVLAEIQHHQGKLMLALSAGDCERVKEYAADLANFAMKVDEQFGGQNANCAGTPLKLNSTDK